MAQPIPFNLPPRDPREALFHKLESAPQEHAEALLVMYDILQRLHDKGVLELVRSGVGAGDSLLKMAVEMANTPEAIRGMRNLIILAKLADSLEPEMLEGLAKAIPETLAQAKTEKPLGMFQLLRKMCSEDTRRAATLMVKITEALGRGLRSDKSE